ncbi:MAG: nucleotide exchange factor GrpE [Synergistaceae bacterium]|jgi:molecular chaperone GrpE|nr:nucleotide exchange factor GrpE [Synergistaceae bacterium]
MFDFFARKKELRTEGLRRDIVSDVEKIWAETISALEERFSALEEQTQQIQRQERRRRMALESLLEGQNNALEALARLEMSPPLDALMALAENLALSFLAEPESPMLQVLYGRLTDLLSCFGLSLVTDVNSAFDPEKHEACSVRCDFSRPENSVLEVVRPGFFLGTRLLRCATVIVNRCDAGLEDEEENTVEPECPCSSAMFEEGKTEKDELYD